MNEDFKIQRASINEVNIIADIKTRAFRDEKERFYLYEKAGYHKVGTASDGTVYLYEKHKI